MMTKDELLEGLKTIAARATSRDELPDAERDHVEADHLLLGYIDDPEVTAAFEAIHKWYA